MSNAIKTTWYMQNWKVKYIKSGQSVVRRLSLISFGSIDKFCQKLRNAIVWAIVLEVSIEITC